MWAGRRHREPTGSDLGPPEKILDPVSSPETVPARRSFRLPVFGTAHGDPFRHSAPCALATRAAVFSPAPRPSVRRWNLPAPSLYKAGVLRLPCRSAASRVVARGLQGTALAFALLPAAAFAAPPAANKTSQAPAETGPSGARAPAKAPRGASAAGTSQGAGPGSKKIISLDDEFLVEGQLEKPSAFYVLQRSGTDHDWARLGATMTPLVLECVWDPLF